MISRLSAARWRVPAMACLSRGALLCALAWLAVPAQSEATPSTTYWAPTVATCQAKSLPHVTYDTYAGKDAAYPIDTGLTIGILPTEKVQAEIGYDLLLPGSNPTQFYLNGKFCVPENAVGKGAPAFSVGMYNIGFKKDVTNYDAVYAMVQKSLPFGGYVSGGFYYGGSRILFRNETGEAKRAGALVGFSSPDIKVGLTGLQKIIILGDLQTGKNVLGGGGVGADIYFNDYVGVIVGPVFYTDKALQPGGVNHLWTVQLDVDIPLGKAKKQP